MRNDQSWESFKNRHSLRRYKWCENAGDGPIVAAAQVSSSLLLLASCTTPAHPQWQRVPEQESEPLATNCKGRRASTESPRVCTSGLRQGFCGPEPEARPELWDHVSWNKQSDCEAMAVPVNWKPCKQTRFCHKAIRRQLSVVLKIWRQPPVVLPLQKWKDRGLCS